MQLTRALELLVLGLSAMSVAEATFVNVNVAGRDGKGIRQRQEDDSSTDSATVAPPDETSSTSIPAKETSTTSDPPKNTETSKPTPTPPPTSSTSEPPSSSSSSSPEPPSSSSSSSGPAPTEPPSSSSSSEDSQEHSTYYVTRTLTTTREDGSIETLTSETLTTSTPDLANAGGSGQSSGMTPQTRKTVIGVVVGVGGAIILGGLALVAWRIWGRKKHQEENDGLMDYGSTVDSKPETGGSMTGRTPFQSTLESYHAPTQVNTAANF